MMESIELVVGAGIMTFGLSAGYVTGRVAQRRKRSQESPKAICEGCGDGLSYHSDDDGCHALHTRTLYDSIGNNIGKEHYRCTCQQYVGHLPADRMLATFLPPPAIQAPAPRPDDDPTTKRKP